eukprot:6262161-Amphidinium_carterae.2
MQKVFTEVNASLGSPKGWSWDAGGVLGSSLSLSKLVVLLHVRVGASGESRGMRLLAHLEAGLLSYSDFSGWDSQEEAMRLVTQRVLEIVAPGKAAYGFVWVHGHKNF